MSPANGLPAWDHLQQPLFNELRVKNVKKQTAIILSLAYSTNVKPSNTIMLVGINCTFLILFKHIIIQIVNVYFLLRRILNL